MSVVDGVEETIDVMNGDEVRERSASRVDGPREQSCKVNLEQREIRLFWFEKPFDCQRQLKKYKVM